MMNLKFCFVFSTLSICLYFSPNQVDGQFMPGQFGQFKSLNPAMNYLQSTQSTQASACTCHLGELEKCSAPLIELLSLSMTSSFPDPASEFESICAKIGESKDCRDKYFLKCTRPQYRETIYRLMFYESDINSQILCNDYSSLYQSKAKCLHEAKYLTQNCTTFYKPAVYETNQSKLIVDNCKAMNKIANCTQEIVRKNCGDEGIELMNALGKAFGINSL